MFDLKNKNILLTGATGGIGAACAKILHNLGANLTISGTNDEKLANLANDLGENVQYKSCNLSDENEVENFINEIEKIDILVCNAGITKDNLSIRMSSQDFDNVINVNLKSSFILNKGAIKKMIRNRWGRIINISSIVGVTGNPGQANYCASKAGLIGMSKSLALEVASRNVTINCIAPGFIETKMTDVLSDDIKEKMLSKIPMQKFGKPEDIGNMVAFLSSDLASYITGQTIHINGGMLMV